MDLKALGSGPGSSTEADYGPVSRGAGGNPAGTSKTTRGGAASVAFRLLRGSPRRRRAQQASGAIPEGVPSTEVLRRDLVYRRALAAVDVLSSALSLYLAVAVSGDDRLAIGSVLAPPLVVVLGKLVGLYDRDEHMLRKTTLEEVPTLFQLSTLLALVLWLSASVSVYGTLEPVELVSFWALLLLLIASGRSIARRLVRNFVAEERCLVLGDAESAKALRRKFTLSFSLNASVVGRVDRHPDTGSNGSAADGNGASGDDQAECANGASQRLLGAPATLGPIEALGLVLVKHDIHRVIVVPGPADANETLDAIRTVKALGVKVSVCPRMFEVLGSAVEFDDVDGLTLLGLHRSRLSRSSLMVKRAMDIVGSVLVMTLLSPLLLAIALAVKLTSRGPVFYRQPRVGRHGVEFDMLKFRSMRDGADAEKDKLLSLNETEGLFKIAEDPRVTRVGRFLRRRSLDELPQLWNVLRGEMSLVGPRPLVPEDDARIEGWQRERLAVVPGMTGAWQILGSTRVPLQEMVKLDYLYWANWSLWTDIKILMRTFLYVLGARSA
jgi:lipopolysaccharide/colanic/teichoic acid biosynthesis glycosyltransferase